jgi:hypothetical protein
MLRNFKTDANPDPNPDPNPNRAYIVIVPNPITHRAKIMCSCVALYTHRPRRGDGAKTEKREKCGEK